MHILIAPDKFKEALTAEEAAAAINRGINRAFPFDPDITITLLPLADGGDGTARILSQLNKGKMISSIVSGPLKEKVAAQWGYVPSKKLAFVELAQASGLHLIPMGKRNPLNTSTYGTGQLIASALDKGAKEIILGLGGSATNDGGTGMAAALGYRILDHTGREISFPTGNDLIQIHGIDSSKINSQLNSCKVQAACDVRNPLLGENGATYTFAPQKGATEEMLPILEDGLRNLALLIKKELGKEVSELQGAGAAGGTGAGVVAFLNGHLCSGAELILSHSKFDQKLRKADLLITGEGKLDNSSLGGKLISQVAKKAQQANVPTIAFCGSCELTEEQQNKAGLDSVVAISETEPDLETALQNTSRNLEDAVYQYFLMGQAF